jgi:hypothetical protein
LQLVSPTAAKLKLGLVDCVSPVVVVIGESSSTCAKMTFAGDNNDKVTIEQEAANMIIWYNNKVGPTNLGTLLFLP